jgi:hypothetical protein
MTLVADEGLGNSAYLAGLGDSPRTGRSRALSRL